MEVKLPAYFFWISDPVFKAQTWSVNPTSSEVILRVTKRYSRADWGVWRMTSGQSITRWKLTEMVHNPTASRVFELRNDFRFRAPLN